MSAAPVNLDGGPPLPPNLQPQQASAQQLAGPQGQSATPNGSASLQSMVIQKLMMAEQIFNDVSQMMPSAAAPLSAVIDLLRKGMGTVLAQGAQPPPAQGPAGGGMMMQQAAPPG